MELVEGEIIGMYNKYIKTNIYEIGFLCVYRFHTQAGVSKTLE